MKSRKVNVIAFFDDDDKWKVAVNIPDEDLTRKMDVTEARAVARVLRGDGVKYMADYLIGLHEGYKGYKFTELIGFFHSWINQDVYPELANQLENMATLAEYSGDMFTEGPKPGEYLQ